MSRQRDDTEVDALAAQVRRFPPLPLEEVASLLAEARSCPRGSAAQLLVEHHLVVALDAATSTRSDALGVEDLYQVGAVAVVSGVADWARAGGRADGLAGHLRAAVAAEIGSAVGEAEDRRQEGERLAADAQLLDTTVLSLRRRLGRPPSDAEVALELGWQVERVELVSRLIELARLEADEEMLLYLDDEPG